MLGMRHQTTEDSIIMIKYRMAENVMINEKLT